MYTSVLPSQGLFQQIYTVLQVDHVLSQLVAKWYLNQHHVLEEIGYSSLVTSLAEEYCRLLGILKIRIQRLPKKYVGNFGRLILKL